MQRLILLLAFCTVARVSAQIGSPELWRFGIVGSATLNLHGGPLTTTDGLAECGTFDNTTSIGFQLGNAAWYRIGDDLAITGALQYWKADGLFTAPNPVQPLVALPDGSVVPLSTEYELATSVDYILLDLGVQWYPIDRWYVVLGPQIGLNLRAAFEQSESIQQPSFMEFTNGGTERVIYAANFTDQATTATPRVAIAASVGRDIPIGERFVLSPSVGYAYAFTNVISGSSWSIDALRAGVGLSYTFGLPEPPPPPAQPAPVPSAAPIPAAAPSPTAALDLQSVDSDGVRVKGADIVATEVRSSDVVPLLPFVFFEKGSAEIPARYATTRTASFAESDVQDSVLGMYHQILNIVGVRMQRYQESTLEIAGYREPADAETTAHLALDRANALRSYLVSTWNINPARITVRSGVLPPVASNRGTDDGRAENRRAELSSTDPRILAPITRTSSDMRVEPRSIELVPTITNADGATLTGTIRSERDEVIAAMSVPPGTWIPSSADVRTILGRTNRGRVTAVLAVETAGGEQASATAPISVRREVRSVRYSNEVVNDSTIERFRLIFFDYDAPTISAFNRDMVDLVRSRIRTTSSLRITGLTDRIGPADRNRVLSLARAQSIDAAIRQRIVPERVSVRGAGAELIYNNDLPEGRLYNRTVLIEVATPIDPE